jgi:serine/threonine protein kinase
MDTDHPISNCCPKCQSPLPADAPQGLCPKCLLAAVATPTEAGQPAGNRPTPPSVEVIAAAFPHLEILEFFGQGGMGFVFKARQPKLDRLVALKILPQSLAADPTFAERFNREAKLLARLNHPGIVTVHDFGVAVAAGILPAVEPGFQPGGRDIATTEGLEKSEAANSSNAIPGGKMPPSTSGRMPDATSQTQFYYLLMEFVDGVNLRQAMQAGRFTPEQALAIVPKICEALQFAHNEGILHRDIKPENILLDAKGRVKIADFGIAKLIGDVAQASQPAGDLGLPAQVDDSKEQGCSPNPQAGKPALHALTEAGKALGTPNYMAPEQLENAGEVDHRADIYSLGVVFYEMLTGELPTGRFAPPSQKSAADPRVDEVVLRALAKEKTKRPASAEEVRTQVETIVADAAGKLARVADERTKSRYKWKIAVGVVVALLIAAWFMVERGRFYPSSSLRSAYKAPEIGRIQFECSDPNRLAEDKTGTSFAVKAWGDTQWGPTFVLGSAMFKTRVDASRSIVPVAMVAASLDNVHWETRQVALGTNRSNQSLGFSNGLRMAISWDPYGAPAVNAKRPSHIQQEVMLRASKLSDAKHPVSTADTSLLFGPVMERTLRFDMNGSASWLDLDSGKYHYEDFPSASITATTNGGLAATQLVMIQSVGRETWETLTADQVSQTLGKASFSGFTYDTGPLHDLPKVWLVKTFHGAMGILQLTSFTENPRGVKLRYKLVESTTQDATKEPITRGRDTTQALQHADQTLKDAGAKFDAGQITLNDLQRAKYNRDIAAAELRDDRVEVARLKLAVAVLALEAAEKKWSVGRGTKQEYERARIERDSAMIRHQSLRNALVTATNDLALKPIPTEALALYQELSNWIKSGCDGDPLIRREATNAKLDADSKKLETLLEDTIAGPLLAEVRRLKNALAQAYEKHDEAEGQRLMQEMSAVSHQIQELLGPTNSLTSAPVLRSRTTAERGHYKTLRAALGQSKFVSASWSAAVFRRFSTRVINLFPSVSIRVHPWLNLPT